MEQTFGMNIIRSFFATLDRAIYGFVSSLYEVITELANATIVGQGAIEDLYARIYTLLGIFMLFKIIFSFINYIINPDSFVDKSKGVQNLVRNVILVLILIIITPYLFYQLNRVQRAILNDEIIPRFIMGISSTDAQGQIRNQFQMSDECGSQFATAASDGDFIALSVLKPFYQLEATTSDIPQGYCATGTVTPSSYLKKDIFNKDKFVEDTYLVDYKFFISTIAGIVVFLIFVSFCFDVAVRSIKMAFLQMIAPIPIMSYIDPASGKNGLLTKYAKQVGATWASLFIRLVALFFAIHIISIIDFAQITKGTKHGVLFPLFIVLGALIAAKQIPKWIENLVPSLKLGGLQLNPFKKVANDALGGKQMLGVGAATIGMGAAAASAIGAHAKDVYDSKKEMRELRRLEDNLIDAENRYNATGSLADRDALQVARNEYDADSAKLIENEQKRLQKFSYKSPFFATISQTITGAKLGFKQGKGLKLDVGEIGRASAKTRDVKDTYSIKDRAIMGANSFFGVDTASGTANQTKEEIRAQQNLLTNLNRTLESMNHQFANMRSTIGESEFNRLANFDARTGLYSFNEAYSGSIQGTQLDDIKALLNNMNSMNSQRLATEKEINRLQKIKDKESGAKAPSAK